MSRAIAIEGRLDVDRSARRAAGCQTLCTVWPKSASHGLRDMPATATGAHEFPSGVKACAASSAHLDRRAALGEIATLLAQEVKNPVGAMLLNAKAALNWLNGEQPNLNEARQAIADIIESGKVARDLINMIDSSRPTEASHKRPVDINSAILTAVRLSWGVTRREGVSLKTDLGANLPIVTGDSIQLQQVLLNLIRYAAEAMCDTVDQPREILVATELVRDGVLVAVRDRGPGLDPASADRLFEPVYGANPGDISSGLAICRSIIEAHDGHLCAVANSPHGTVVQFVLPTKCARRALPPRSLLGATANMDSGKASADT
ncbi:MAG: HAMP domain-containing histidine kinase [Alphaproteobacteria bacterium]|nr:HAMP domain-containing histidine kinase [Alphaproteobacteria bacterium]